MMIFDEKIIKRLIPKFTVGDDCWEWLAGKQKEGYGTFFYKKIDGKRITYYAHRVVYEWLVGPIPEGLTLDHTCYNRGCVNPKHLIPVTQSINAITGIDSNYRKTHCPYGHEYTPENIYRNPSNPGSRHCRTCNNNPKLRSKIA